MERDGQIVVTISKRWPTVTASYGAEVAPGEDDVLILASVKCVELGIKHVRMHPSYGQGGVSDTASADGREHGITVTDGQMPAPVRTDRQLRPQGHARVIHPPVPKTIRPWQQLTWNSTQIRCLP